MKVLSYLKILTPTNTKIREHILNTEKISKIKSLIKELEERDLFVGLSASEKKDLEDARNELKNL